jgi:hypothetical protein
VTAITVVRFPQRLWKRGKRLEVRMNVTTRLFMFFANPTPIVGTFEKGLRLQSSMSMVLLVGVIIGMMSRGRR